MHMGVNNTARPPKSLERDLVPIVQEADGVLGPVWTGAENLTQPRFDPRMLQPVASRYTD